MDTEGPFSEPIKETFRQLYSLYGIDLEPTDENLKLVQSGESLPYEKRDEIMRRFSKHRLSYNESWSDIDAMCETLFSIEWRKRVSGNSLAPYTLNWNCLDQIGFHANPRRRQLGPNLIYQYYERQIKESGIYWDRLYWHYHPIAFSKALNRNGTSLNHTSNHYLSLCHRILDCFSFPSVFRPGYHIERTDLNVFLEQWIPFDYANQNTDCQGQRVDNRGRFQNWSGSTKEWKVYHPSFKDPRTAGNLNRSIARCLNIGTDFDLLDEDEIDKAFSRCASGKPTILSYCNHDHRDMISEIEEITDKISRIATNYKDRVNYQYCNAVEAMNMYYGLENTEPVKFTVSLDNNRLFVECSKELFSAQPFLALQTYDDVMFHDNFSFGDSKLKFFYTFDEHSIPLQMIKKIGIAANDSNGNSTICRVDLREDIKIEFNYIVSKRKPQKNAKHTPVANNSIDY